MSKPEDVTEIREDSYYDHDEYGRVHVVSKSSAAVLFECLEDPHYLSGMGIIPHGKKEDPETFCDSVVPADITVSAPASTLGAETNKTI